jgi:hypothetical protein
MVIAEDGTAHKKTVTLGIQTHEDTQILSGLSPTDMVISTGGYGLDDGTRVKIGTDPNAKPEEDAKPGAEKPAAGEEAKPGAAKPDAEKPAAGKDADEK